MRWKPEATRSRATDQSSRARLPSACRSMGCSRRSPGTVAIRDCAKSALTASAFVGRDRKHHAAETWNLQQEVPTLGIAHIAHGDEVGNDGTKIEWRAHDQKALRPSEAGKFDSECAPYLAAGAVGADEPAAGTRLASSFAFDRNLHARAMLGHVLDLGVELQLEIRLVAQLLVQNARQLGLLALQPVGVA